MSQQRDPREDRKRNFNVAYTFALALQRGIVVPIRNGWGQQALGWPCFYAFILMILWATFTRDDMMLAWMGLWLLFQAKRRIEANRLVGMVHSQYDGMPINLGRDEQRAKLIFEPLLVALLGVLALMGYREMGWSPAGLPYFLISGSVAMVFVQLVHQMIWKRRLQSMSDATIDQQILTSDFQNQYRP